MYTVQIYVYLYTRIYFTIIPLLLYKLQNEEKNLSEKDNILNWEPRVQFHFWQHTELPVYKWNYLCIVCELPVTLCREGGCLTDLIRSINLMIKKFQYNRARGVYWGEWEVRGVRAPTFIFAPPFFSCTHPLLFCSALVFLVHI